MLYTDGTVACLGANGFGQLGTGDFTNSETFAPAPLVSSQRMIAAGKNHSCASDGSSVYCWGDNQASQLGVEAPEQTSTPFPVASSNQGIAQLEAADQHTCYLDGFNHGHCWGTDALGVTLATPTQDPRIGLQQYEFVELGGGLVRLVSDERLYDLPWDALNASTERLPTRGAPTGVLQNAIAQDHDCVLRRNGSVWCRGEGYRETYAAVADFGDDVLEVEVSRGFDCVRTGSGEVLCRGRNDAAQLGNGTLSERDTAGPVAHLRGAIEISLAAAHACARLNDGSVWCWGTPPGIRILTEPSRFATPTSDEPCPQGVPPPTPRPWNLPLPEPTGAEDLSAALVEFGRNTCRCWAPDPGDYEECVADQVRVLSGCLEALASDLDAAARCLAYEAWASVECSDSCREGQLPEDCGSRLWSNGCGTSDGVFAFCQRGSLGCDGLGSATEARWDQTCNGVPDCESGFDEANCTPAAVFTCADGSAIALELVGDTSADCADGSDEWIP